MSNLNRFIEAQAESYPAAFTEISSGRKRTHWMWYIFPQVKGLGFSQTSKYYAIEDINEAAEFLKHPVLGGRLINISKELLKLATNNATNIFGGPDDLKLKSSMTLFSCVPDSDPVFQQVLDKFFDGTKDENTLKIIEGRQ
jgi:uncharacterized protein (DUF1810 family)